MPLSVKSTILHIKSFHVLLYCFWYVSLFFSWTVYYIFSFCFSLHVCCNSCSWHFYRCCFMYWRPAPCRNSMKYYTMWYLLSCMQVWLLVYLFLFVTGNAFESSGAGSHISVQLFIGAARADAASLRIHSVWRGEKEGEEALMKISADLTTFEIVLFKSTMACIHTYFISIALCMLREAMGIIYVAQEERERDKGKER